MHASFVIKLFYIKIFWFPMTWWNDAFLLCTIYQNPTHKFINTIS